MEGVNAVSRINTDFQKDFQGAWTCEHFLGQSKKDRKEAWRSTGSLVKKCSSFSQLKRVYTVGQGRIIPNSQIACMKNASYYGFSLCV